jgi:bifunctional oligoribonuclease and PAP phosphatase NrnA
MQTTALDEIIAILDHGHRILVLTHIAPDGDAIGSLLGMGWLLRQHGKSATLVEQDTVPPEFRNLPGADEIRPEPPEQPWDAVVCLDASDPARLGMAFRPAAYGKAPVVVIDHHVTNLNFGRVNYVDPSAAATAQLIVRMADAWGWPISREAAECLLTGLVTDTRGFRTSNVTVDVMATGLKLMEAGANLADIAQRTLNYKPLAVIKLWGPALEHVQAQDGVVWTQITQEMRRQVEAPNGNEGGLVSLLLEAPEANVSAVFAEKPDGRVEIGLRARPRFDVARVALSLGGGGHPQAAGCTIDGPLTQAEERVLPLLADAARSEG